MAFQFSISFRQFPAIISSNNASAISSLTLPRTPTCMLNFFHHVLYNPFVLYFLSFSLSEFQFGYFLLTYLQAQFSLQLCLICKLTFTVLNFGSYIFQSQNFHLNLIISSSLLKCLIFSFNVLNMLITVFVEKDNGGNIWNSHVTVSIICFFY